MMLVSLGVPQQRGETIMEAVKSRTNPTMYMNAANPREKGEGKGVGGVG